MLIWNAQYDLINVFFFATNQIEKTLTKMIYHHTTYSEDYLPIN